MVIIDGITWDFGPSDPIDYFDPEKSYYITKYRPINRFSGLDFNPDWFREDGLNKLKTGKYSDHRIGSKSHRDFWLERKRRCEEGYEVNGYRITGDNYFWLNFYRLKQSKKGAKAGAGREMNFPMFLVFQYEYFHYVELCEVLNKDVGLLKARALGFSEMGASLCVRPFITTPNYRVVASAFSERHLKPLLSKIWSQLDWLNDNTELGFRRVRMVKNTDMHKRASKKAKDGGEFGHMSEIEGIVADSPEKIRGDRTERLLYEEAGSDKVLTEKYLQGEALVKVMGDRVGIRIVWGTGGDSGPSLAGIRDIVNNPDTYDVLKYRHNHTPNGQYILSAMFIPAHRNIIDNKQLDKFIDKRGWCDPDKAKREYWDPERLKKSASPKALLIFKSEYCYTIDEALIQQGDNIFPREELAEQEAAITIYKTVPPVKRGSLVWDIKIENGERVRTGKVIWRDDPKGNIFLKEHPILTEENLPYKNLYVGGIDSIDIGQNDSSSTGETRVSDFCIVIKKRVLGQSEPDYVALYKERPKDPREAYENAAKLLIYFNCKAVLESTRTAIITYFRDKKFINLLMKRPRSTMPDVSKGNSQMYGAPATIKTITHYRELIYDYILDYSHNISFLIMVEQLLKYSDEDKKLFDVVAAMGMAELGDEELSIKKPEATRETSMYALQDIGWWTDGRGYKHYGVIPKTKEEKNATTRIRDEDSWLYKDEI